MGAFKNAIKHGYPIEFDVHVSADNEIIVFHDDNLRRLTGTEGLVHQTDWTHIKKLRIGKSNESIPTLKQVLKVVDGRVPLLIEVKSRYTHKRIEPALSELLGTYKGQYAIQSFNPKTVRWFRKHRPSVSNGYISGSLADADLPAPVRFVLSNLLLVPFIRPDFVAYEFPDINRRFIKVWRVILPIPFATWVIRSKQEQATVPKGCNIIFESYAPKQTRVLLK
jgi:glycerophosphoryl diester phosphodiesterase